MATCYRMAGISLASIILASCNSDRTASPPEDGPPAYSATGIPSSESAMRARLDHITRAVALALRDQQVRAHVYQQLHASPDREHKLHFQPFASRVDSPFSSAIASAAGLTDVGLRALLDSVIDLEFYMPVKEHWAQWTGGGNLLVAWAFRDHEVPVAYDLSGAPVILTSAEEPPPTPTLAIVPVETDFSPRPPAISAAAGCDPEAGPCCDPAADMCDPPPSSGGGPYPATTCPSYTGLCMTYSTVPGDWEGFLMGDPEFEVHVLKREVGSESLEHFRCAGEHAPVAASVYDQNTSTWQGTVELLTLAEAQTFAANDTKLVIQMWEDDRDACVIRKNPQWVKAAALTVAATFASFVGIDILDRGWDQTCRNYSTDEQICWLVVFFLPQAPFWIIEALQNDDYVGEFVPASLTGGSDLYHNHTLINEKGQVKGSVFLAGPAFLPATPPPAPFAVTISGPGAAPPNSTCTWSSNVSGAPGPPTFEWYRNGQLVATASSYTGASGDASFDLLLSVVSGGQSVSNAQTVSVSAGSPPCPSS